MMPGWVGGWERRRTLLAVMRPPRPVPGTLRRSTPASEASFLAYPEATTRSPGGEEEGEEETLTGAAAAGAGAEEGGGGGGAPEREALRACP